MEVYEKRISKHNYIWLYNEKSLFLKDGQNIRLYILSSSYFVGKIGCQLNNLNKINLYVSIGKIILKILGWPMTHIFLSPA